MRDPHLVRDIRAALSSPQRVAKALGLKVHEDAGSYVLVLCPVHAERSGSCSIHKRDGGLGVKCWGCKWTGDVLTLVAAVEGTTSFQETLARAAELAGMQDAAEAIRGGKPAPERKTRPAAAEPEPERDYPPPAEVAKLWAACQLVTKDAEVSRLLESRGIDPWRVENQDVARALHQETHHSDVPAWARFRGRAPTSQPWTRTGHRLILPTYDADGGFRSVRAWLVTGDSGKPKRVPPAGHRASGLVVANRQAVEMLRGDGRPSRVIIVEGEPDFLARSVLSPRDAVLGVMSGSWSEAFAARIPYGSEVIIRTHLDDAGERYAGEVFESVCQRAVVSRLAPTVDA